MKLGKVVHVYEISTTYTNWNNQCILGTLKLTLLSNQLCQGFSVGWMGGMFICNKPILPVLSLTYKGLQSRLNINNKSAFHGSKFALTCERHDTMDRGFELPCRNPCRLVIHDIVLGPSCCNLLVWSELGRCQPFWPTRDYRATSHTRQEPWPWNCGSPKESVQGPSQDPSNITSCDHGPSSVVWSHMWPGPQPNAISMYVYPLGSSHMIK